MGYLLKRNGKVAIEKETIEGVYQGNPASGSFIKANVEGGALGMSKEELSEDFLGTGNGMTQHKQGLKTSTAALGMALATNLVEGEQSPMGKSLESLLGNEDTYTEMTCTSSSTTTLTIPGHSFKVGDIVIVKEAGAFEARPISAIAGDVLTLKWALSSDPSETVKVAAMNVYSPTDTGHSSLSITRFNADDATAICEKVIGAKCISMSLDNFVTGQLADISFSYEGLDYKKENLTPNAPSFAQAERSAILGAWVFQNGVAIKINEFSLSVQNTLAAISDVKNGKTSLKVVKREVSGSINPYQTDGAAGIAQYNAFNANLPFSLFVAHSNPTAVEGENANWIAFWMPVCARLTLEEGDYNGIATETISFRAYVDDSTKRDINIAIS